MRCDHQGCPKKASFGLEESKKVEFCAQHKKQGMVDVYNTSSRCIDSACTIRSSFGLEGSKKAEFCAKHKKQGMVSTRWKRLNESRDGSTHGCERTGVGADAIDRRASAGEQRKRSQ